MAIKMYPCGASDCVPPAFPHEAHPLDTRPWTDDENLRIVWRCDTCGWVSQEWRRREPDADRPA